MDGAFGAGVALLLGTLALVGCTATIHPPQRVAEPAAVAVLDHGRHASLVVEVPGEPAMIRYAYGDWAWYALRKTGPGEAIAALFWPTPAALGRRRLPGPLAPATVTREVRVGIEDALYFDVEAREVRRLVARLDAIFDAHRAERVDNEAYDLEFVPHPDGYSIAHGSNQMVGAWLEALGCRVEDASFLTSWRLASDR